jgi:formyl-CoA transferase
MRVPSNPIDLSASPASTRRLAPRLGEHTVEVLGEMGFTDSDIDGLVECGATRR